MNRTDESMGHATGTLAQLREADRNSEINAEASITEKHADILDQLADEINEARRELDEAYDAPLADIEIALQNGATATRNEGITTERELRDAMYTNAGEGGQR